MRSLTSVVVVAVGSGLAAVLYSYIHKFVAKISNERRRHKRQVTSAWYGKCGLERGDCNDTTQPFPFIKQGSMKAQVGLMYIV